MISLQQSKVMVFVLGVTFAHNAMANPSFYPNNVNAQNYQQSHSQQNNSQWGPGKWINQMQNQFNGQNNQNGNGNIFQDAKGFYKMMGNGNTKWKFYFDFDFQMEMDAWMKAQNRANTQNRMNPNWQQQYQQQQYWNHQGQIAPGYYYHGQGHYQGYVYPQQGYYPNNPNYYGQPIPQR